MGSNHAADAFWFSSGRVVRNKKNKIFRDVLPNVGEETTYKMREMTQNKNVDSTELLS